MASDVIVPEVGELGMDVTFVRWLKEAGEEVAIGDPLFEVDTEKSVMVVEAYAAGTLSDVRASEGDIVAPRDVIGRILSPGEPPDAGTAEPAPSNHPPASRLESVAGAVDSSSAAPAHDSASPDDAAPPQRIGGRSGSGVSPRARRVAGQLGVDLGTIKGSGPDGLITESDVRAADASDDATRASSEAETRDPRARARKAVADLTTASWQTIPHFFLQLEADIERGLELARPTPLICASVAQALLRHPECNLRWDGDTPMPRESVDLGLLVDAPAGLLIAVIKDAQEMDLADMADAIRAAAERARRGTLATADMGPRSLTVSNLGMYAVDRFSAVIPRPDILTLAVGRTRVAPRWNGSRFEPGRVVDLTLSVDHRALDGAAAARFMTSLEAILRDPVAEGLA